MPLDGGPRHRSERVHRCRAAFRRCAPQVIVRSPRCAAARCRRASTGSRGTPTRARIDAAALEGIGGVVHLAGAGIGDRRWTRGARQLIVESRTRSTELLASTLTKLRRPPGVLRVGVGGRVLRRPRATRCSPSRPARATTSPRGSACNGRRRRRRLPTPASGSAPSAPGSCSAPTAGCCAASLAPFRLGLGGRLGSGRQYLSWISLTDETRGHPPSPRAPGDRRRREPHRAEPRDERRVHRGARPRAAPPDRPARPRSRRSAPCTGRELVDTLLLASQRAVPAALTDAGFDFEHPTVDAALRGGAGDARPDRAALDRHRRRRRPRRRHRAALRRRPARPSSSSASARSTATTTAEARSPGRSSTRRSSRATTPASARPSRDAAPEAFLAIGPLTNVAALVGEGIALPPLTLMGGVLGTVRHWGHATPGRAQLRPRPGSGRVARCGRVPAPLVVPLNVTLDGAPRVRRSSAAARRGGARSSGATSRRSSTSRGSSACPPTTAPSTCTTRSRSSALVEPTCSTSTARTLDVEPDGRLVETTEGALARVAVGVDARRAIELVLALVGADVG